MGEIPPELYEKLMDGRQEWSRHGYLICARAMVDMDEPLDEYRAYRDSLIDSAEVFGGTD